jgi:agmatinase
MNNFLGDENTCSGEDAARVVILPVPYEASTSYGKGTAAGPAAIINASAFVELFDEELFMEPYKAGIFAVDPVNLASEPHQVMNDIEKEVSRLLEKKKFVIIIGGEHSISFGVVSAFKKFFPRFSVLQFDAHSDLRDEYEGSRFSHASVMKRIWNINPEIVQLGIRSQSIEERNFIIEKSIKTYYAKDLILGDIPLNIIKDLLPEVYVTFDVDFLDPSIMPSTGTPEPGGFSWNTTCTFLRELFRKRNVIGMDVVELCPNKSLSYPDFITSKLIYKCCGYFLEGKSG